MTSSAAIADRIVEAVLAQRLAPGTRLREQQLADLFGVSRTLVREAMMRLATRGIITVTARRGWFVIEPSLEEAREAFDARRAIELGLLHQISATGAAVNAVRKLRQHIGREKAALKGDDVSLRSFLLGDFHVCMAECLGNSLLADTLRDFTARTTLISMLYQTTHDAEKSCAEHVLIVAAIEAGDFARARELLTLHLGNVETGLSRGRLPDAMSRLRDALTPGLTAGAPAAVKPGRRGDKPASRSGDNPSANADISSGANAGRPPASGRRRKPIDTDDDSSSTYLGDVL